MSDYPLLRASLAPEYAELSEGDLDQLVRAIYGGEATAEDVEGLFDDIGRGLKSAASGVAGFAQKAAPILGKALPAIAAGAGSGAAFGPIGALVGAGVGAASGLLSQSGNKTARSIGGAIHDVGGLVSTVRGGGASGALGSLASVASGALGATKAGRAAAGALRAGGGGGGAANALLGLLSRPELAQALNSSALGAIGRRSIPVGGQQVPVHQMLAALGQLGQRAAHEAAEYDPDAAETPAFAEAAAEAFGIDADDAEDRTDALLTLLALSPSVWSRQPQVNVQVAPQDPYFGNEAWSEYDESWEAWDNGTESELAYEYDDA